MSRSRIAIVALGCLAGCATGPSASGFTPAISGHGVESRLYIGRRQEVRGELVELRDTAYVVINDDGLLLVPFSIVDGATFSDIGGYNGGAPGGEWRERLRLVSRFPHGIPDPAFAALLSSTGQTQLRVIKKR